MRGNRRRQLSVFSIWIYGTKSGLGSNIGIHGTNSKLEAAGRPRRACWHHFGQGLKLRSPVPLISRRALFFRPITISSPSTSVERTPFLTVEMQSSTTNKSTIEPIAPEDTKKIGSGEIASASPPVSSRFNFGHFSTLFNIPTWAKFVLGSVVLFAIPIIRQSHNIKDVTKAVEEVAEAVEKAAEVTEKVAEQIAEALPEGTVKEAALQLEKIALLVDKEAEFTEAIINMVDDVVEVMDTNLKLVEGQAKKNEEEDKVTLKKIVVDQSKEALQ